jgi:hypothetical protein
MNQIYKNKISSKFVSLKTVEFRMPQVVKRIIPLAIIAIVLYSCSDTASDVKTPTIASKLVNKADSVYAGELTTFDFTGALGDNLTLYTGDSLKDYAGYPASKGAPIPTPYGKYYYKYTVGGIYKVFLYAETAGVEGTIYKEKKDSFLINVKDRRTGLSFSKLVFSVHLSIKSKLTPTADSIYVSSAGTLNATKDTLTIKLAAGIKKTKLNPVPTYSIAGATYVGAYSYYGSPAKVLAKTDSIDFTTPVKFTVVTRNNPVTKSYVVVAK